MTKNTETKPAGGSITPDRKPALPQRATNQARASPRAALVRPKEWILTLLSRKD